MSRLVVTISAALLLAACGHSGEAGALRPGEAASRTTATAPSRALPFAPSSFWRTPLQNPAVDADSDTMVSRLQEQVGRYGTYVNTTQYSVPVYEVGSDITPVRVVLDGGGTEELQDAFEAVPLPPGARGSRGSDGSAVVWQPSTDTLWEFWKLRRDDGTWRARWGGRIEQVSASSGVYEPPFGVAASGLSLLGGLLRDGEVRAGRVDHPIAISVPEVTARVFRAPATRTDGKSAGGIPLGSRFRLDPAVDVGRLPLSPAGRVVAAAAQRYGFVVTDTSVGCVCLYAEDPASLGSNPWPELFGVPSWKLLNGFPWAKLQLLAQAP
jgi:hypothetical protein